MTDIRREIADGIESSLWEEEFGDATVEEDGRHDPPVVRVQVTASDGEVYYAPILTPEEYNERFAPGPRVGKTFTLHTEHLWGQVEVAHNLGTTDLTVSAYDAKGLEYWPPWHDTSADTISVKIHEPYVRLFIREVVRENTL